jgi:adenylate cyclase
MVCDGTYRHIFLFTSGPDKNSFIFKKVLWGGKMAGNANPHPITIDLNQFKLHIELRNRIELTLHFNSPSRKFYLSVIAFVVNEMKRLGKITSIPLEGHHDLLALLNETVGGSAGSSETETLLSRIYRKWQHALPSLEEAPLFVVLGRKKGYEEGIGKTYLFTEAEKDSWANLFEYKGNHKNVRLKFAIDKIGATLNDISVLYEDSLNGEAWEKFISSLREKKAEPDKRVPEEPEGAAPPLQQRRTLLPKRYRWVALLAATVVVLGAITLGIWKNYLRPNSGDVASIEKMAFPLPDEPSIAVLPFVNMSEDPKQEFVCDGMTEEIITALSKVPRLFVIARNSTFTYKGKPMKVKQVSEELGVRYVLEGSVQRSADRIRINTQLIDALTGRHLWAERYERDPRNIFALQDEITAGVLRAVQVKLTQGEISPAYSKHYRGKQSFDCWLKQMEGAKHAARFTIEDNNVARRILEEAIAMCPENPVSYAQLGFVYLSDVRLGNTKSPGETLKTAKELAQKALAVDDSLPLPHLLLSDFYVIKREHDKAIAEAERAVALDPSGSAAYSTYARVLNFAGRSEEAIPLFQKAIRLSPNADAVTFIFYGDALRVTGRFEEAVSALKKGIQRAPDYIVAHLGLLTTYSLMGRDKEARAEAEEVLRINPMFSLDYHARTVLYFKDQSENDKVFKAMRKARLK